MSTFHTTISFLCAPRIEKEKEKKKKKETHFCILQKIARLLHILHGILFFPIMIHPQSLFTRTGADGKMVPSISARTSCLKRVLLFFFEGRRFSRNDKV
jgi:hypothetical protein